MKNFNKVVVSIREGTHISGGGLESEIRRAIYEYIYKQHEYSLQLFKQGKISEAQELLKSLEALMTFKVEYAEEV